MEGSRNRTGKGLSTARANSVTEAKRPPSVHWISPSVFKDLRGPRAPRAKIDDMTSLTEVFDPETSASGGPKERSTKQSKKARKHHELPVSGEPKHRSKRAKQAQSRDKEIKSKSGKPDKSNSLDRDSGTTDSGALSQGANIKKPRCATKRLSYILNNDPYNVLGVSPRATKSAVKRAYKCKAIGLHPDKGGSEEEFIKLTTAYDVLVDDK